jgi:hypothetical protein
MAETADALRLRRELALAQEAEAKAAAARAKSVQSKPWTHSGTGAINPATPGGAGSAAGLVMLAGAIAFFGNMKVDKGFPKAGAKIITATILLAIILSLFDNGRLSPVARGIGYLMVLSALVRYVPKFSNQKGK